MTIEYRVDQDGAAIAEALPVIERLVAYLEGHGDRFVETPAERADLEAGYGGLLAKARASLGQGP